MKTDQLKNEFPKAYFNLSSYFSIYGFNLKGIDMIGEVKALRLLNISMGYSNAVFDLISDNRIRLIVADRLHIFEQALKSYNPDEIDFITKLSRLSTSEREQFYPETIMVKLLKLNDTLQPIRRFSIKHDPVKYTPAISIKRSLVPRTDISYMERKAVEDKAMQKFWEESIQFSWRKEPCPF